jgi:hypothetical protein
VRPEAIEKENVMSRPYPGDRIEMACMGEDVDIQVCRVPDEQPRVDEGIYAIVDQYGETHEVELDGDTWSTVVHAL